MHVPSIESQISYCIYCQTLLPVTSMKQLSAVFHNIKNF